MSLMAANLGLSKAPAGIGSKTGVPSESKAVGATEGVDKELSRRRNVGELKSKEIVHVLLKHETFLQWEDQIGVRNVRTQFNTQIWYSLLSLAHGTNS